MNKLLFLAILAFILTLMPFSSAECAFVQLSKQAYYSGENFQAEITGEFKKPLAEEDLGFYRDNIKYSIDFNLEQIANDKWLVWAKVPTKYGENKFRVVSLCQEETLIEEVKETNFIIQRPLQEAYSWLISKVDNKWSSLSVEDIALALNVLNYDSDLFEEGKSTLLSKSSSQECWPSSTCEVKPTSLAAIPLKDSEQKEKIKAWLLDAENNIELGLWDLIVTSNSAQTCDLTINGVNQSLTLTSGANSPISLTLPDDSEITLTTACSLSSAKVSNTYLGKVHNFPMQTEGLSYSLVINNKKCWGEEYRSECDVDSTAYAILALEELGETSLQEETAWLGENIESTEQRAIYYSLTNDNDIETWLINNQAQEGFWAKVALALSNTPDVLSTVLVTEVISGNAKLKGETWLKNLFESQGIFGNQKETSYALRLFSSDKIEPLISSTGLVKVNSGENLTISFTNNGIFSVNLSASLFGSTEEVTIFPSSEASLIFSSQKYSSLTFTEAEISYNTLFSTNERSYRIPIIIFPSGITEEETETILNETSSGGVSLFPAELQFTPDKINSSLTKKESNSIIVKLTSLAKESQQVSIATFGLSNILESIEPADFEISPGKSQEIEIIFNTENAFGEYSGSINAETSGTSVSLPIELLITEEEVDVDEEVEKEKKPLNKKAIGWTMLALAAISVGVLIYLKLFSKKPQQPLKIALDKVGRQKIQ
ncbi:hypothetical protein ACFLZZ_02970 [Nanoarchaeota archaeon]